MPFEQWSDSEHGPVGEFDFGFIGNLRDSRFDAVKKRLDFLQLLTANHGRRAAEFSLQREYLGSLFRSHFRLCQRKEHCHRDAGKAD